MTFRKPPTAEETKKALHWIVELLQRKRIPFQIVGGLAARAYGSTRALVDIDLYVPSKFLLDIADEVKDRIAFGPKHVKEEFRDITYMAIFYDNQKIEVGDSTEAWIFSSKSHSWLKQEIRFDESVDVAIFDLTLPVMPLEQLLEYKAELGRPVDIEDIQLIRSLNRSV